VKDNNKNNSPSGIEKAILCHNLRKHKGAKVMHEFKGFEFEEQNDDIPGLYDHSFLQNPPTKK